MDIVSFLFNKTVVAGFIVGIFSLYAISRNKSDLHMLLLSDLVECAMLVIIAAVGTDLAEALILPGLVVGMAELLAVSEVLVLRNELKNKNKSISSKKSKLLEEFIAKEVSHGDVQFSKMEVLSTAPKFMAVVLVIYGAILTGFTGGAVIASGLLFYLLSQTVLGNGISLSRLKHSWESISGFSGIMWSIWVLFGFVGFFLFPQKYLYFLLIAGCALALKVGSKLGLIGELIRD
jgi:energy-converting hydrogenase A subunit G